MAPTLPHMKTFWMIFLLAGATAAASAESSDLESAHRFRFELAQAVAAKTLTSEEALGRLRTALSPSRKALGENADFGQAADALGRHLMGMGRPDAAEPFFVAAVTALEQAANGARDAEGKAQYLAQLATIQALYLNRFPEAKANIAAAIRLRPEDKSLVQRQALLTRGRGDSGKRQGQK
jgi:tetratricopeptide (TPR) repeat protein